MKALANIFLFFLLIQGNITAQYTCGVVESKTSNDIPNAYLYNPNSTDPIIYLRINIHFLLKDYGDPGYPGNYTKVDDGKGNSNYTGYDFAQDLIDSANIHLSNNIKMNLPPGNSTAVLQTKYRFVLNAVYFHENSYQYSYYYSPAGINNYFNIHQDDCINVFFQGENLIYNHSASANMSGARAVAFNGNNYWDSGEGFWALSGLLVHEIGHNLSLLHTIIPKKGVCNVEDYCSDTPTNNELINNYGIDPCSDTDCYPYGSGSISTCPNNRMGYSGSGALTPLQLGRVHWTIENEIEATQNCYYISSNNQITSFNEDNSSYIAESISIPSTSNIEVENNSALYIKCEEFIVNGTITIESGSKLTVNIVSGCN